MLSLYLRALKLLRRHDLLLVNLEFLGNQGLGP